MAPGLRGALAEEGRCNVASGAQSFAIAPASNRDTLLS